MSKRKSAPPRRLDAAAREAINFDLNKYDDLEQSILSPPASEEKVELVSSDKVKKKDEKPHTLLSALQEKLEQYEESLEREEQTRQRKKQRQAPPAPPPSFCIPFNESEKKGDIEKYLEIMEFSLECERADQEFFDKSKPGKLKQRMK